MNPSINKFNLSLTIFLYLFCGFIFLLFHPNQALSQETSPSSPPSTDPTPAAVVSCVCPKVECDPCKEEKGLTFYTEKCGLNGEKVRSCAKPTCEFKKNLSDFCLSRIPASTTAPSPTLSAPSETSAKRAENSATLQRTVVGQVQAVEGVVWRHSSGGGPQEQVTVSMPIYEQDTFSTEKKGRARLEFQDGNVIHLQTDSHMTISKYETSAEKRKALIQLLRGQIRNQVKKKYNNNTGGNNNTHNQMSGYEVHTPIAVAGVRGTDFIVHYHDRDAEPAHDDDKNPKGYPKDQNRKATEITTLEGLVNLSGLDKSQSLEVETQSQASYVITDPESQSLSETESGFFTPKHKLNQVALNKLKHSTFVGSNKSSSPSLLTQKLMICSSPPAEMNACLWQCQGNPSGEKRCRTDQANVRCIRKRCNANGDWAEETQLPPSLGEKCPAIGTRVDLCDY